MLSQYSKHDSTAEEKGKVVPNLFQFVGSGSRGHVRDLTFLGTSFT